MSSRSRVLLAMIVAMVLGYMPWYNFSAVLKQIAADFHLTSADTGLILSAFQAGYVLVVPFTGWLADRIGLKRVLFWATLSTAVFSTAFAFGAQDRWSTLALRLLTGLSAGAIYVPGLALLSRWFSSGERGGALGAYTGAVVAAYAGGYFVASPIALSFGWRWGILWTSLPAFLAAMLIYLWVREPDGGEMAAAAPGSAGPPPEGGPVAGTSQTAPEKGSTPAPAPEGGNRGPVILTLSYMGHMWELYAFWGWVGPFLVASTIASGVSPGEATGLGGALAAGIILLGAPAPWLWGIVADRRGRTAAIIVAASMSLLAELVLGFLYGQHLLVVALVAAWVGFWVIADSAVYKAGLTEMVLPTVRGTYLGLQSAVGYFMTILAPVAFGLVLEYFNGPVDPTSATVWGPAFLLLGLGALLAPVSSLLLRRQVQAKLMANGKL